MAKNSKKKGSGRSAPLQEVKPNMVTAEEIGAYLDRVHEINDRMDADRATHMGDMSAVYEEAAGELNMTKEVFIATYKKDRARMKAEKKFAKADSRTRDSLLQVAKSFGPESSLGQWAAQMAAAGSAQESDAEK